MLPPKETMRAQWVKNGPGMVPESDAEKKERKDARGERPSPLARELDSGYLTVLVNA
jgi:hypothetical protein